MFTRTNYLRPLVLLTLAALAASVMIAVVPASPAQAADLTVSTVADEQNTNEKCSLREAIFNAINNDQSGSADCAAGSGADTIKFNLGSSATITLNSVANGGLGSLPAITDGSGLTIDAESANITISGGNAVQVFMVPPGAELTLKNLTIANGGFSNDVFLFAGGGIFNGGTLTVNNSTLTENRAAVLGGGIANQGGTVTVNNSTISGNSAPNGGGIFNQGGPQGGTVTVNNSTFSENDASNGGGIANQGGTVTVNDSTISGNSASIGGGIANQSGGLTVNDSTFSGNSASNFGGGIANADGLTVDNSTFSRNSASNGGGISNQGGTSTVNNSTISGNSASGGSGTGGGIANGGGTATLRNTIVANSPSGGNCSGTITDGGYNLDSGISCAFSAANNSLSGVDPKLDPLFSYGGPTQTHRLQSDSPAIDAGPPTDGDPIACPPPSTDQRGISRPRGNACDIGSFELEADTNNAPQVTDDNYSTDEDTPLSVDELAGVLSNDSDADGDNLTAVQVSAPTHGSLILNNDGSFSYTPNADYNGPDSFTYKATDGSAESNTAATVHILVTPVNDPPVANDDELTTDEDTAHNGNVLTNDTDVDNPNNDNAGLTVKDAQAVSGPAHGTLDLNADGSFTYTPDANYHGPDSFTYKATDGNGGEDTATVNITVTPVNDAPELAAIGNKEVHEGQQLSFTANATDPDEDAISYSLVAGDNCGISEICSVPDGANIGGSSGEFSWTPTEQQGPGTYKLKVKATDNGSPNLSAEEQITITVAEVNVAPELASIGDKQVDEDQQLSFTAQATDADEPANNITYSLAAGENCSGTEECQVPSGASIDLNTGEFSWTPGFSDAGTYKLKVKATDDGSPNLSAEEQITITVNNVNRAPVATGDTYSVNENATLTANGVALNPAGVLSNDSDADGDNLTAVQVSAPTHGSLILNNDGSFSYTPEGEYYGPDSFTYKANDGTDDSNTVTVNITVNPVNDEPIAEDDTATTPEDTPVTISADDLLANDSAGPPNESGQILTITAVSNFQHGQAALSSNGSSVTFTPEANYFGSDASFDYTVCDNGGTANGGVNCFQGTAIVQVTVTSVNDAPVAANDVNSTDEDKTLNVAAPGVLGNDTDVEGDSLTAEKVSDPAHGTLTLNTDGSFTYTPNGGFSGSDSFTYKANDSTAYGNVATVDITVNAVNDDPVAVEDTATTDEDTAAVIPVLSNDTDADGDSLSVLGSSLSHPAHGTVELITSGTDAGKVRYTPNANYNGSDTFTYKANDGTADSNEATVSVTVTAVNDAPVAVNDSYSTNQGNALTVNAPGVLGNDSDVDSANLTAAQVLGPSHGQLTLNANGSFTYAPVANFSGADSFTYKVHDGSADSNTATVTITVGAPAPMVTSVSPPNQATGVLRSANVTATFNVAMNAKTLKSQTFILTGPGKKGPTQVSANVTCNDPCTTATLTPSKSLAANTMYTATVKSAVADTSGKTLGSDYNWSFTTGG